MTRPQPGEETLMAYVDGALSLEDARAVEAAAAADEAVAARLDALRRTRAASRDALAPLLDEPVPAALEANLRAFAARHPPEASASTEEGSADNVVAMTPRRAMPRAVGGPLGLGLAASIALAVGVGAGFLAAGGAQRAGETVVASGFGQAGLAEAIDDVPSGAERTLPGGDTFRAIATFALEDGALCREFELDERGAATVVGVACRDAGAWRTRFAVATAASGQSYAPAASLDVLQAYLTGIGAQAPLDPAEEAAALQNLDAR